MAEKDYSRIRDSLDSQDDTPFLKSNEFIKKRSTNRFFWSSCITINILLLICNVLAAMKTFHKHDIESIAPKSADYSIYHSLLAL